MNMIPTERFFVEVPKIRDGQVVATTNRRPTLPEADEAVTRRRKLVTAYEALEALKRQIKELQEECPHVVFYDTPGWPYDSRTCAGCDKDKGLV